MATSHAVIPDEPRLDVSRALRTLPIITLYDNKTAPSLCAAGKCGASFQMTAKFPYSMRVGTSHIVHVEDPRACRTV